MIYANERQNTFFCTEGVFKQARICRVTVSLTRGLGLCGLTPKDHSIFFFFSDNRMHEVLRIHSDPESRVLVSVV